MKKSILALSILLSTSVMADYKITMSGKGGALTLPEPALSPLPDPLGEVGECIYTTRNGTYLTNYTNEYHTDPITYRRNRVNFTHAYVYYNGSGWSRWAYILLPDQQITVSYYATSFEFEFEGRKYTATKGNQFAYQHYGNPGDQYWYQLCLTSVERIAD